MKTMKNYILTKCELKINCNLKFNKWLQTLIELNGTYNIVHQITNQLI